MIVHARFKDQFSGFRNMQPKVVAETCVCIFLSIQARDICLIAVLMQALCRIARSDENGCFFDV